jgi:phage terminase large subunit-like protein
VYVNQAKFEAGLVLFPKGALFLPELEAELLAFPQGKTDDQVDSISQGGLAWRVIGFARLEVALCSNLHKAEKG